MCRGFPFVARTAIGICELVPIARSYPLVGIVELSLGMLFLFCHGHEQKQMRNNLNTFQLIIFLILFLLLVKYIYSGLYHIRIVLVNFSIS